MVDFCPECSGLLRRQLLDGKGVLVCRCGYKEDHETSDLELQENLQKKKEELEERLIVVKNEDKIIVNIIVLKTCPKCDHHEAEAWQEQTRSADEPSTSFFRCMKCKFTFREY